MGLHLIVVQTDVLAANILHQANVINWRFWVEHSLVDVNCWQGELYAKVVFVLHHIFFSLRAWGIHGVIKCGHIKIRLLPFVLRSLEFLDKIWLLINLSFGGKTWTIHASEAFGPNALFGWENVVWLFQPCYITILIHRAKKRFRSLFGWEIKILFDLIKIMFDATNWLLLQALVNWRTA